MVDNVIGMLVGAAIDREDGDSGIKGALIGGLAEGAVKLVLPAILLLAVGFGVRHMVMRGLDLFAGDGDQEKAAT